MADYSMMEEALEFLAPYGPDLSNGMTNHAPMAVEALAAMGRADAVMPWLEIYRGGLVRERPPKHPIARDGWREAIGRAHVADWSAFFREELETAPWREVLGRWTTELVPAVCASATHGVLRVGHAARSLAEAESPARRRELADAFASWIYVYQTLPAAPPSSPPLRARDAIAKVRVVPPEERRFSGSIVSGLVGLSDFPPFAEAIGLLDVRPAPAQVLADVTETFARVFLANARDVLTTIVFIHGVTSVAAMRSLVPYLPDAAVRGALSHSWQASCALYSAFANAAPTAGPVEPPAEDRATLIDMAIANGDDHAIKFTEACLREYELNPAPVFLAAARQAIALLPPAR